jgi:hypothetical protein
MPLPSTLPKPYVQKERGKKIDPSVLKRPTGLTAEADTVFSIKPYLWSNGSLSRDISEDEDSRDDCVSAPWDNDNSVSEFSSSMVSVETDYESESETNTYASNSTLSSIRETCDVKHLIIARKLPRRNDINDRDKLYGIPEEIDPKEKQQTQTSWKKIWKLKKKMKNTNNASKKRSPIVSASQLSKQANQSREKRIQRYPMEKLIVDVVEEEATLLTEVASAREGRLRQASSTAKEPKEIDERKWLSSFSSLFATPAFTTKNGVKTEEPSKNTFHQNQYFVDLVPIDEEKMSPRSLGKTTFPDKGSIRREIPSVLPKPRSFGRKNSALGRQSKGQRERILLLLKSEGGESATSTKSFADTSETNDFSFIRKKDLIDENETLENTSNEETGTGKKVNKSIRRIQRCSDSSKLISDSHDRLCDSVRDGEVFKVSSFHRHGSLSASQNTKVRGTEFSKTKVIHKIKAGRMIRQATKYAKKNAQNIEEEKLLLEEMDRMVKERLRVIEKAEKEIDEELFAAPCCGAALF